jgi:hypothetical protein
MARKISQHLLMAGKVALKAAFADLRKQGIYARQNYQCCGGCACSQMGEDIKAAHEKTPGKYMGGAYYHRQDAEDLRERGYVYIGFGAAPDSNMDRELVSLTVGQAVNLTMRRYGLEVEWDGTTDTKVLVSIPPSLLAQ